MKITVDKETCIGCGSCAAICPAVFEMAEDGKSEVKKNLKISKDLLQCAESAAEACPVQVIRVMK